MKFDTDAFRELFLETLTRKVPVSQSMAVVIESCRKLDREANWPSLLLLPFDEEVAGFAKILNRILTESPPPETVKGFIFGADELFDGPSSQIALQLVSAERIDADDPGFGQSRYDLRYEPPIAISSDILRDLHQFAMDLEPEIDTLDLVNALDDLDKLEIGAVVDHVLLWTYSALAVAYACDLTEPSLWIGNLTSRKIYVGHGEDYLRLGFIESQGFRRDPLMD